MSLLKTNLSEQYGIYFLTVFLVILYQVNLFTKEINIESIVGREISIADTLTFTSSEPFDTLFISGILLIGNNTLFFADSADIQVLNSSYKFDFINDNPGESSFNYSRRIILNNKQTEAKLRIIVYGEVLAGNDSLCSMAIRMRSINGLLFEDLYINLKVANIGAPLPYLRFPFLSIPIYYTGKRDIYWEYWFDQDSEVAITMYDICGRARVLEKHESLKKGTYNFTFIPDFNTTAGLYYMVLTTNTGFAYRPFMVTD